MIVMKMRCECLIDQDRYIGEDPVGYCCSNAATKELATELGTAYFCDSCIEMLDTGRITFRFRSGQSQEQEMEKLIHSLRTTNEELWSHK